MKNKTILIVDDVVANLDILEELLNEYDIVDATNGKDALKIVNDDHIDLILLDIMMPEMDGYEVCHKLKENPKNKNIPIIFLTAKTDEKSIEKAYDMGGVDYVTKPFLPKELQARVKTQFNLQDLKNIEVEYKKQIAFKDLIHNIAHQWRQPLSIISMTAGNLMASEELNILKKDSIQKAAAQVVKQCDYLSSTLNSFTSFSGTSLEKQYFNLDKFIEENYSEIFEKTQDYTLNLDIDKEIEICSHYTQLLEVFKIIINNAIKFRKPIKDLEHLVFIVIKANNNKIIVDIYDNGIGLDNNIIEKVFEPYFTTEHQSQGKGMSLYLAYNIVNISLNGTLEVFNTTFLKNKKEQTGAQFRITLPLKDETIS